LTERPSRWYSKKWKLGISGEEGRQKSLGKFVNNSLFLIRPYHRLPPLPRIFWARDCSAFFCPPTGQWLYGERQDIYENFRER